MVSVFEGVKREWLFSKEISTIDIIPLNEEETDEDNFTSFIFSISEIRDWTNLIVETIPYFRGVIFDNQTGVNTEISHSLNSSKLIEGNNFYHKENHKYSNIEICLDQVVYNINCYELNIYPFDFPFALKFSTKEGLMPTPSRENLILTENTKNKIKQKLKDALIEIHGYYPKEPKSLWEHFLYPDSIFVEIENTRIIFASQINKICLHLNCPQFIKINPVFNDLDILNFKYTFFDDLYKNKQVQSIGVRPVSSTNLKNNGIVVPITISAPVSKYLREKFLYCYIYDRKKRKLWGHYGYYTILQLKNVPRNKWRGIINEWINEQNIFLNTKQQFDHEDYKKWLSEQPRTKAVKYKKKEEEIKTWKIESKNSKIKFLPEYINLAESKWFVYTTDRTFTHLDFLSDHFPCRLVLTSDIPKLNGKKFILIDDFIKSKGFIRFINNSYLSDFTFSKTNYIFPNFYPFMFNSKKRISNYSRFFGLVWPFNITFINYCCEKPKRKYSTNSILWRDNKIKRLELEIKKLKKI